MKFAKQKIAVLGLGIEGIDVCRFLLKNGARQITVFDQKTASKLKESIKKFPGFPVEFKLGKNYLHQGLKDFDIIYRSPAFKLTLPAIVAARNKGIVISSVTKLFFTLCPGKTIGVTGTKGKGTTATLIYQILKKGGKKVFLAGNIGAPMLSLLPKITKDSWVVLELSSFQLQDLQTSPHLAVVLFITSDHLDYHQNRTEYIQAKANIVRYQQKNDYAVLNVDNSVSTGFSRLTKAKVYYFSRQKPTNGAYVSQGKIYLTNQVIGLTSQLELRGQHNWDNICAAVTAGWLAGARADIIKKTVFSFSGLEHRLEFVGKVRGISFYNDSFSTTPETAIAAMKSFTEPLTLIAGGSDKGADFQQMSQEIAVSSVRVLVLIGKMAQKIQKAVQDAGFTGKIIFQPPTMKEAVRRAYLNSRSSGVVLLSPACASFDMFKNYKDRGEQFKKNVKTLSSHS